MNRRKDLWTPEQDELLATIVLDHISSGSTQLKAFEETAEKLNRTAASCGFRWNSKLRKMYQDKMETAKKQQKNSHIKSSTNKNDTTPPSVSLDQVISYIEKLTIDNNEWVQKFKELESKYETLEKDYNNIKKEYKEIVRIINTARTLANNENKSNL